MATLDDTLPVALMSQINAVSDVYYQELRDAFEGLGWWGSQATDRWLAEALPIVSEAQLAVASIADTMMDIELEMLLDGAVQSGPVDPALVTGAAVRGTDPSEVYARPLGEVWRGIGDGRSVPESVSGGLSRLESTFRVDNERVSDLVFRNRMISEPGVTGFRRVPTSGRSCALCLIASTQRYRKERLKGIHPSCRCKVVPIVGEVTGRTVDRDLLERIHGAVREQYPEAYDRTGRRLDYRQIMVEHDHGELGPVLSVRGQHFTGPGDLHAAS